MIKKRKSTAIPGNKLPKEQLDQIKEWARQNSTNIPSISDLEQMLVENQLALCELVELFIGEG